MHIPDGFLDLKTTVVTSGATLGVLVPAIRRVNRSLTTARVPLIGLSAAFIFTAQLISFPVPGGTSVHITGAVLIAILLGPATGLVITTAALLLQALMFQHGGITSLGANILNMGVAGCYLGAWIHRILPGSDLIRVTPAVLLSVSLIGLLAALELGWSGTIPFSTGIPAMSIAALLAAVAEAFITLAVIRLLQRIRPDLLELDRV